MRFSEGGISLAEASQPMSDLTQILQAIERGENSAERLLPLVYEELRKLASASMCKPAAFLRASELNARIVRKLEKHQTLSSTASFC